VERTIAQLIVATTVAAAIIMIAFTLSTRADGLPPGPPGPPRGVYPVQVPMGNGSCLMTAQQMAYLTGRRDVGYAATEACMLFTGARGAVLPYGYYGPFVSPHFVPPGWAIPLPPPPPFGW
jgi:hypothetical protein